MFILGIRGGDAFQSVHYLELESKSKRPVSIHIETGLLVLLYAMKFGLNEM